jgi:hypothetical protein
MESVRDSGLEGHDGQSTGSSAQVVYSVNVTFAQKSVNAINAAAHAQIVSTAGRYPATYTLSGPRSNKATVSIAIGSGWAGWTISGNGSVQQTTSESGKITMQKFQLSQTDYIIFVNSRITMNWVHSA